VSPWFKTFYFCWEWFCQMSNPNCFGKSFEDMQTKKLKWHKAAEVFVS